MANKGILLKAEAVKRMELIGINSHVRELFENDGILCYSDSDTGWGNYPLKWEWSRIVGQIAERKGIYPYFVICSKTCQGDMLNIMYVSKSAGEWADERLYLLTGAETTFACCYVYNLTNPDLSEFGTIGFEEVQGVLKRTQ